MRGLGLGVLGPTGSESETQEQRLRGLSRVYQFGAGLSGFKWLRVLGREPSSRFICLILF